MKLLLFVPAAFVLLGTTPVASAHLLGGASDEDSALLRNSALPHDEPVESNAVFLEPSGPPTVKNVKILFFASAREAVNTAQEITTLRFPAGTTSTTVTGADLKMGMLLQKYAVYGLTETFLRPCAVAVNEEYVAMDETVALKDGDEIAVIPPVSGG